MSESECTACFTKLESKNQQSIRFPCGHAMCGKCFYSIDRELCPQCSQEIGLIDDNNKSATKTISNDEIFIKPLNQTFKRSEWDLKTHFGRYRKNQIEQHAEINLSIFDLVHKYKDTNHPLSNFLVLLIDDNDFFKRRTFAGRMADLSQEQIQKLRTEFFIYHDKSGTIRSEFESVPGKSWSYIKPNTSVPSFYIVQGKHPNIYNRHNISWDFPRTIETDVCSTRETYDELSIELYKHGFGDYESWEKEDGTVVFEYQLYDHTDKEFLSPAEVEFIRIFEHISETNVPLLFLHEKVETERQELEVTNWTDFGRGVLGHTNHSGGPDMKKVPQTLIDKHLRVTERIPTIRYPKWTMKMSASDDQPERIVSIAKKGEFLFIEGYEDKQRKVLKKSIEMDIKYNKEHPDTRHFSDEFVEDFMRIYREKEPPSERPSAMPSGMDHFIDGFMSALAKNPPK